MVAVLWVVHRQALSEVCRLAYTPGKQVGPPTSCTLLCFYGSIKLPPTSTSHPSARSDPVCEAPLPRPSQGCLAHSLPS